MKEVSMSNEISVLVENLRTRVYPDVARVALSELERIEARYGEGVPKWGHGPAHVELKNLGLVEFGGLDPTTYVWPVRLTNLGRAVAEELDTRAAMSRCPACGTKMKPFWCSECGETKNG